MTATITRAELHSSPPPMSISARNSIALPNTTPTQRSAKLPSSTAPRIDVEPIYTALKASIGDSWQLYKATLSEFVLGKRNQAELAWIVDPFLRGDPQRESLHNQFIMALFANAQREPPDQPGVASWVAANDKPTTAAKPVSGDAAEQQLKAEIMQMTARERHRIKNLQEDTTDGFAQVMAQELSAIQISLPDAQTASAGGYSRTNWEPEVRKRYAQPLAVESNEFPDPDSIGARMLPICFEEEVFNGYASGAAEYMNIAGETYIKDFLTRLFTATRSNGPRSTWIRTEAYKKRLQREEDAFERGEIRRSTTGLLPVEQESESKRRPLSMWDIRLNLDIGGTMLSHHAPKSMAMFEATGIDDEATMRDVDMIDAPLKRGAMSAAAKPLTNGIMTNGVHKEPVADDNYGWQGGADADRMVLDGILDDIMDGL